MSEEGRFAACLSIVITIFLCFTVSMAIIGSHYKAKSFNKLQDPNDVKITWKDAFWNDVIINSK